MPAVLWIATVLMTMLALSFVLKPLAGTKRQGVTIVLAIAVPAFATSVYLALGSPGIASASPHPSASEAAANTAAPHKQPTAGSITTLADGLAARLEKNPDDGKGWLLLAKSYQHLNRIDDARNAYTRATALGESDASLDQLFTGDAAAPANTPDAEPPLWVASTCHRPCANSSNRPTCSLYLHERRARQAPRWQLSANPPRRGRSSFD